MSYTAKSIIIDVADNHGSGEALALRSVEFYLNEVLIALTTSDFATYSTSCIDPDYFGPDNIFDTTLSKIGFSVGTSFGTANLTDQRVIVVFNSAITFDSIVVNNFHDGGYGIDAGANHTKIYTSTDTITNTAYSADTENYTLIFDGVIAQHLASDAVDDQELSLSSNSISNLSVGNLLTGTPVVGVSTLGQKHILSATWIITGAPVVGIPIIGQRHALAANNITIGSPNIAASHIHQEHNLTATSIIPGEASIELPDISQAHIFASTWVMTGCPDVGYPSLSHVCNLISTGITTGLPFVFAPDVGQVNIIMATYVYSLPPVLDSPILCLAQVYVLNAANIDTMAPVFGAPVMVAKYLTAANYLTIDTNLKNRASGQYINFNANSMAKFNRQYWAAGNAGLYLLDSVDTVNNAYLLTATMDFGINNDKRLRYVYLSLESTGNLSLIINTEKVSARIYAVPISGTGQQDVRIPISRELYGRFWTFKISGVCDFSIDEIKILPILRNLKI